MKMPLHTLLLMAIGLTALPPVSIAHGISAGRTSAVATHHNDCHHDRYRYSCINLRPPYDAYVVRDDYRLFAVELDAEF